jgi:flagellar basal body-associated protein FliL
MQPEANKNSMNTIVTAVVCLLILVGGYFGYTYLFSTDDTTSEQQIVPAKLGQNMSVFTSFVSKNKINLDAVTALNDPFVTSLVDYSETFATTSVRGRLNPFVPYDLTRPLR